jgi:hypothetical protein
MTKKEYTDSIKMYQKIANCELFFQWLKENPGFLDRNKVEIQINFMMYTVAALSFIKGYQHGTK